MPDSRARIAPSKQELSALIEQKCGTDAANVCLLGRFVDGQIAERVNVRQNSDRRAEKEGHQIERIDTQDPRLEIECCRRGDDQIERAEEVPRHCPFKSIRSV